MTTIAYKDGILAADSQMTNHDRMLVGKQKLVKVVPDLFVGLCGPASEFHAAISWLTACQSNYGACISRYGEREGEPFGIQALLVQASTNGLFMIEDDGSVTSLTHGFYAIGTGADLALGAMAAGSNAVDAVEIAATFDIYTGGPINTLIVSDRR